MPAQETKISLFESLKEQIDGKKLAEFHNKVKGKEPSYGFSDLPGGIKNGKGQIMSVKVGVYAKGTAHEGKKFVAIKVVAHEPATHNGITVAGRSFNQNYAMCDTPERKGFDGNPKMLLDNYNDLLDEFKKLGIDCSKTDVTGIDALIDYVNQKKPWTLFSTKEYQKKDKNGQPKPGEFGVGYTLDGKCEPSIPTNGASHGMKVSTPATPEPDPAPDEDPAANLDAGDIDSLIARTKANDGDAEESVRQSCYKLGYTDEQIDDATSWEIVGDWIKTGRRAPEGEEGEEEGSGEAEKLVPVNKGQYHYRPKDKKGVPAKNPIEVQVMKVDPKAETCKVKNLTDGKTVYENVPWSELSEIPEA